MSTITLLKPCNELKMQHFINIIFNHVMTRCTDIPYWLHIHSLILMFDSNFTVGQCSQCCLPTVDPTTSVNNIL